MRQKNSLHIKRILTSTKHGNEIFMLYGGEGNTRVPRIVDSPLRVCGNRWVNGRSIFGVIWSETMEDYKQLTV